jgi:hypothetical protein
VKKTAKPESYEMLLNEVNVPKSMNILNRLKEKLKELRIQFKASKNKSTLDVDVDILSMVQELIEESQT